MDRQDLPKTLREFEARFAQTLPEGPTAYFSGASADEITLRSNTDAWSQLEIFPRVLVDVSTRDPSVRLLGSQRPHPLVVAPTAYHGLAHPRAEEATAAGAAQTQTPYTLSTLATRRPADVAKAAPNGSNWFQIYRFKDRAISDSLMAEAIESGFEALVLTVDLPLLGRRDRELESNFTIGDASLVPGVSDASITGEISMQDTADLIDPSLTWKDVEELSERSPLPVILKGILRPDDALQAIACGAAGVVVSNHGGRQLDTTPATATVLEGIRDALGPDPTVLVDGGIRRGTDVLKALVLGADAVMVGRPVIWGLATAGEAGVAAVLNILLDEFDRALALSGCPQASDLAGRFDLVPTSARPRH
ncbi:MAG: alpha-hydroxy acid oxidase [Solirubrobacterales bacterium]|nr:alpha-hydroxy acid oxidase [Solirubrobacterales bacterium]